MLPKKLVFSVTITHLMVKMNLLQHIIYFVVKPFLWLKTIAKLYVTGKIDFFCHPNSFNGEKGVTTTNYIFCGVTQSWHAEVPSPTRQIQMGFAHVPELEIFFPSIRSSDESAFPINSAFLDLKYPTNRKIVEQSFTNISPWLFPCLLQFLIWSLTQDFQLLEDPAVARLLLQETTPWLATALARKSLFGELQTTILPFGTMIMCSHWEVIMW